ncbi:MAG: hypothetical protein IJ524_05115 [Bacteroidales bacterium]|nr:hypothetical protein [Bacteroidales bacterium]
MKRTLSLVLLLLSTVTINAQTGLYKRYATRPDVQAYCVERYPLNCGDSVCVTLLQTDDSAVYRTLLRELHDLPYAPKRLRMNGTIRTTPSDSTTQKMPEDMAQQIKQKADSTAMLWRERKHLVIFNADGLPGDKGYYAIYYPSDRMVVLAFLVTSDEEALKIAGHMTSTELNQEQ